MAVHQPYDLNILFTFYQGLLLLGKLLLLGDHSTMVSSIIRRLLGKTTVTRRIAV